MRLLLLFCICALIACTSADNAEMAKLEQEVADNPTNANVSELLEMYKTWLDEHPGKNEKRKEILRKVYTVSDQHIRYNTKIDAIKELAVYYPDDAQTADRVVELADIYDKMRKGPAAMIIRKEFRLKYPDHPLAGEAGANMQPDSPSSDSLLKKLGLAMFNDSLQRLDQSAVRQFVDASEAYAILHMEDTSAVEYLHKAAEAARNLRAYDRAIELFDWIIDKFPEHQRASQALFLKAFTYDNDFNDTANARKYYTEFIANYPDDDFADDAQFLLENLGKADDELLRELQRKAEARQAEEPSE